MNTQNDPQNQRILALAALFLEDFSIDWLITLSGAKPSAVLQVLDEAQSQGLVIKKDAARFALAHPERKQALAQSLPPDQAREFNARITRLLLEELPDGVEKARLVSGRLLDAINDLDQCRWLAAAGDEFMRVLEAKKAFSCYLKVLEDLDRLPGAEADALYIETAVKYSRVSDVQFDMRRTQSLLKKALTKARELGDLRAQALLQMHLAKNSWYRSRYKEAAALFQEGWALARTVDDPKLRRSALTFSTFFHYWQGRFQDAVDIYESEIIPLEEAGEGRFPLMAESTVGNCYNFIGQAAQGFGVIDAVRSRALKAGDVFMEGFNGIVTAICLMNIQRPGQAMEHVRGAVREAQKWPRSPLNMIVNLIAAYGHFQGGEPSRAVRDLKRFLDLREQIQVSMWPYPYLLELCWAMEEGRLPRAGGASLEQEIGLALQGGNVFMTGIAHRFQALILQKQGAPPEKIQKALEDSERCLAQSGHVLELHRSRLALAAHHEAQGRPGKARAIQRELARALSAMDAAMIPADLLPLRQEGPGALALARDLALAADKMMEARDAQALMHQLIAASGRMIGAERGAVFLWKGGKQGGGLELHAARNLTAEQAAAPEFGPARDVIHAVMNSGEGVMRNMDAPETRKGGGAIRSLACLPLKIEGKVLGALYHDNRMLADAFRGAHVAPLTVFAALLALALDRQRIRGKLQAIEDGALEAEPAEPPRHGMVGQSRALVRVLDLAAQAAPTSATVLILGETGTGKELAARAVHASSPRRRGPFISINCNALPDSLISSELFGHEKGAFTGAAHRRPGRFELAAGGTLFLDEIGELPLETQVKLLRVLQTREFERIGGSRTLKSDFRLIAATHRDLEARVREGLFREDLYYRLNIFPIHIPPLRQRKEDIPLLARHFLRRCSLKAGKRFASFPEREMEKLLRHDWPGNVRELENVMERGAILSHSAIFRVPDLTGGLEASAPAAAAGLSLRDVERNHIVATLESTGGKIRGAGGAAELLEIHPSTLYSRMKKLGIAPGRAGRRPAK